MAFWTITLWFGWMLISIRYLAWGAELTTDQHERTRITTRRTALRWALKLISGGLPALFWILALITIWNYSITETSHARTVRKLQATRARHFRSVNVAKPQ